MKSPRAYIYTRKFEREGERDNISGCPAVINCAVNYMLSRSKSRELGERGRRIPSNTLCLNVPIAHIVAQELFDYRDLSSSVSRQLHTLSLSVMHHRSQRVRACSYKHSARIWTLLSKT